MTSKLLRMFALLVLMVGAFSVGTGLAKDDNEAKFQGTIESLPGTPNFVGDWKVSGHTVHVTNATRIDQEHGAVKVGASVKVEGTQLADNSIDANEIQVEEAAEGAKVEFTGTIQSLPSTPGFIGDWMVSGRVVHVTNATRIDQEHGAVKVGATVKVEGTQRADNSIDANEIQVEEAAEAAEVEFTGTIQSLPSTPGFIGDWMVSGRVVHVTNTTRINQEDGALKVGANVKVEGTQRADGSIDAHEIEVLRADEATEFEFTGTIQSLPSTTGFIGDWMVSGRIIHVTAATRIVTEAGAAVTLGAMVEVKGTQRADGSIDASQIEVKSNVVEFEGVIESLPSTPGFIGDWKISGRTVHVSSSTQIQGTPVVGARVQVKGTMRADNSIDATRIEVKGAADQVENQNSGFKGSIESLPAGGTLTGDWMISGRIVHVTSSTRLQAEDGTFLVGATVKVKGIQMTDGSVVATKIQLKNSH